MTFCPQCGKPVAATESFCTACGMQVVHTASPAGIDPLQLAPARRPPGVGIIGSTMILIGSLVVLIFLGGMYLGYTGAEGWDDIISQSAAQAQMTEMEVVPIIWAALVGGALFGGLAIVAGIGALLAKRWAWVLMIGFMMLNAIVMLFQLPSAAGILGVLVSGVVLWYFLRPEVKGYFGKRAP